MWVVLQKYFPAGKSGKTTNRTLPELRRTYWRVELFLLVVFFVMAAGLTFLTYHGFLKISHMRFASFLPQDRLLLPNPIMWVLPSLFLAMLIAIRLSTQLQSWLLRDRYSEYVAYTNMKYQMDGERVVKVVNPMIIVLIVVFTGLGLNHFAYFDREEVVSSSFFQLSISHHTYHDIKQIQDVKKFVAPNGKVVDNQHYVIKFDDKSRLGLRSLCENDKDRVHRVIGYTLQKSGLDLKEVLLEE